jgi:hypothetical protein
MKQFEVTMSLEEAEAQCTPEQFKADIKDAKNATLLYYLKEMIRDHFIHKNPNGFYPPNTIKYEEWKRKHYGLLPQLVLSGRLRAAVLAGKVKDGNIVFNLPEYHIYQLRAGRDFLSPTKSEERKLKNQLLDELFEIRKARIIPLGH